MVQTIAKKIDNSHVVWFEQSNRWVQFEEPAWLVNKYYLKGIDKSTISKKIARKYQLPNNKCNIFVNTICSKISEFTKQQTASTNNIIKNFSNIACSYPLYSVRHYTIGNKHFTLNFDSRIAEYHIHPPLSFLEKENFETVDIEYEIFSHGNELILREKNCLETTSFHSDFNKLKQRLFKLITNNIHNKCDNDWMSFVHASALTNGKQTVLLASASGSGKSSMAALLQTKGLQLVSDDFVPIDAKSKRAFPFPAAISVKEGAFDLLSPHYGNLHEKSFNSYEFTNKSLRFLPPCHTNSKTIKALPVKNIVFIRYNAQISCNLKLVPASESLKLFHEQAWVSGKPAHAKAFINWFAKVRCYSLEYGDTEKGINTMLQIFDN